MIAGGTVMDYKKEIKALRKHRKSYYPALSRLMDLYDRWGPGDHPRELINDADALIFLELIDIGYLDENALIIKRRFDDIVGLVYGGDYPLTEGGEKFYKKERRTLTGRLIDLAGKFRLR
jgi:hypothetical protein